MGAHYGPTNPSPEEQVASGVRRFASFVELVPEQEQQYRKMHAEVWPQVVAACKRANMRNYCIWIQEIGDKKYVFRHFEYTGSDPEADFAAVAEDPTIKEQWWPLTDGCMRPVPGTPADEMWREADLAMHLP
ncbi:L-rhamnose mutarotase [Pseudobythopirellula maris]|uniref:L-rhamnose mutarotase n=1 Tax=Pseudobythopirellula maris TaxID=2527991 RepID=A0A5C5ZUF3_9BACT|nr:L-rhamnose mutarotase [Pseudobythopirellula maris]TWT89803.1 L-rhamnose mutarotase [Pseudobythopirellula maris]